MPQPDKRPLKTNQQHTYLQCQNVLTKKFYQFRLSLPRLFRSRLPRLAVYPDFDSCYSFNVFNVFNVFQCILSMYDTYSVRLRAIIEVPYCYFIIVMNIVYTIQKKIKLN